jgi:hypothetical protein
MAVMTLERIFEKYFSCKKTYLIKPRLRKGRYTISKNPQDYEVLTKHGIRSYNKLVYLLQDLELLFENNFNANIWIKELDEIVVQKRYISHFQK